MKYGVVLILIAVILGGFGLLFGQFGLDVISILVALLAIGIFLWSFLHLSLRLRSPRRGLYGAPVPRTDEEQAALLGEVIFKSREDLDVD